MKAESEQKLFRAAHKSVHRVHRTYVAQMFRQEHEIQRIQAEWQVKKSTAPRHPALRDAFLAKRTRLSATRRAVAQLGRLLKLFKFVSSYASTARVHAVQDAMRQCILEVQRYPALFPATYPGHISFPDWPVVVWRAVEPQAVGDTVFSMRSFETEVHDRRKAVILKEYLEAWQRLPQVEGYEKPTFDVWVANQLDKLTN